MSQDSQSQESHRVRGGAAGVSGQKHCSEMNGRVCSLWVRLPSQLPGAQEGAWCSPRKEEAGGPWQRTQAQLLGTGSGLGCCPGRIHQNQRLL